MVVVIDRRQRAVLCQRPAGDEQPVIPDPHQFAAKRRPGGERFQRLGFRVQPDQGIHIRHRRIVGDLAVAEVEGYPVAGKAAVPDGQRGPLGEFIQGHTVAAVQFAAQQDRGIVDHAGPEPVKILVVGKKVCVEIGQFQRFADDLFGGGVEIQIPRHNGVGVVVPLRFIASGVVLCVHPVERHRLFRRLRGPGALCGGRGRFHRLRRGCILRRRRGHWFRSRGGAGSQKQGRHGKTKLLFHPRSLLPHTERRRLSCPRRNSQRAPTRTRPARPPAASACIRAWPRPPFCCRRPLPPPCGRL